MFEHIRADTMRFLRVDNCHTLFATVYSLYINFGLHALIIYRFGFWLAKICKTPYGCIIAVPLYPLFWLLSVYARKAYGIDLRQSAEIGSGFYIAHFGGIEVKNCRIGPRCSIHQQVKLGSNALGRGLVIGEGVFISTHAQIDADVIIGDGATIGAGSVVTQNIPPYCLVMGNPGRIIQRGYNNNALL